MSVTQTFLLKNKKRITFSKAILPKKSSFFLKRLYFPILNKIYSALHSEENETLPTMAIDKSKIIR